VVRIEKREPMSEAEDDLVREITGRFGDRLVRERSRVGERSFEVSADDLIEVVTALRDEFGFEQLVDVCGVDYLLYGVDEWRAEEATRTGFSRAVDRSTPPEWDDAEPRYAVVYHLLSVSRNKRLRLRVRCADNAYPSVPSVVDVWPSANWFEREAFDLFGVLFDGHPDLRRILTDYGFIGHPFRKDFPLSGNVEVRYDPAKGRVIYQPVSITPRVNVPKVIRPEDNRYRDELKDGGAAGGGGDA
jgi:NADH-quinone oxidoreductase subunit C